MNQYILINRIKVQNANSIAGFTWGFPAITHFLGFSHNLARKLANTDNFKNISLMGCAVVAHKHHVHTYRSSYDFEFTQSRNPPSLSSHDKAATPPVIEEGKMNMTVSLLIKCEGNIGNSKDRFIKWLMKASLLQRLAGGTILTIGCIDVFNLDKSTVREIKRKLLPGFILMDRSHYLEKHYQALQKENQDIELLDAWLDFSALQQKARPKTDLIGRHLKNLVKNNSDDPQYDQLMEIWLDHLNPPYQEGCAPETLIKHFAELENNNVNKGLLEQWQYYCAPDATTDADWEYIPKPEEGYLVPIMTGYKAISIVYKNSEVENTRDNETDVCFVESVHSIGEWLSVHRLKNEESISHSLWNYHYEKNWYLCKQVQKNLVKDNSSNEITVENPDVFS